MSDPNNKKQDDVSIANILWYVFVILLTVGLCALFLHIYYNVYNPEKRKFKNGVNYAYSTILNESRALFMEKGYVFKADNKYNDELCMKLVQKYSFMEYNCNIDKSGMYKTNLVFEKPYFTIMGLNNPPFKIEGTLAKDIIIDIDGEEGENETGVDRIPIRVYSSGRLGGEATPINCNREDEREYEFKRSLTCGSSDINYLHTNEPFGFDVDQIGGDKGKTRSLNKNVSFLRADCTAFGGEMLGGDFCDDKKYYWIAACYDEYPCAVNLSK